MLHNTYSSTFTRREKKMKNVLLGILLFSGFGASAHTQQLIEVDFTNGQLRHFYGDAEQDVYPVVLPREAVRVSLNLIQPVHGQLNHIDHKPTWWPTKNTRRKYPSLPRKVLYGRPEHPIGIYRLRIAWTNPSKPDFWRPVRIHGGAKTTDLYLPKSAGCVRMLDEDIERLVENVQRAQRAGETEVQISFGFFSETD